VLIRAITLGELTEVEAADRRGYLVAAAAHWHILASVLTERMATVGIKLLSLDDRVRKAAKKLGLELLPE